MNDVCLILDGFALTYRAYFGLPSSIQTKIGPINAVLGFYNILSSLLRQIEPAYVVVAWDSKEPTFRHKMFPAYKAQRPPMPDDLRSQLPLIKEVLASCTIPLLELPGYEADDIIGTLTKNLPARTDAYVVTTDRDALQLVNERVSILVPNRKENKIYTPVTVQSEWKVPPNLIPDLKALMGDSSDNIPGISKVGPKTATKWLATYKSLEGLISQSHELKGKAGENLREQETLALFYRELATIDCNTPIFVCWQSLKLIQDFSQLRLTLDRIGIRAALPHTG